MNAVVTGQLLSQQILWTREDVLGAAVLLWLRGSRLTVPGACCCWHAAGEVVLPGPAPLPLPLAAAAARWAPLLLLWGKAKLFGKCHLCFYPSSDRLEGLGQRSGGAARASAAFLGVPHSQISQPVAVSPGYPGPRQAGRAPTPRQEMLPLLGHGASDGGCSRVCLLPAGPLASTGRCRFSSLAEMLAGKNEEKVGTEGFQQGLAAFVK